MEKFPSNKNSDSEKSGTSESIYHLMESEFKSCLFDLVLTLSSYVAHVKSL